MASSAERTFAPGRAGSERRPGVSATDLMMLGMAVIWGVNFSVVKYGTNLLHPLAYNSVRVSLAAAVLGVAALATRVPKIARRDVLALLALGVLGNGLYQLLFIEGVTRTRAGTAALILAASPAFIAIIGRVLGVERVTRRGVIGIALSVGGIAAVIFAQSDGGGTSSVAGNALVLLGGLSWALYSVLLKPYANRIDGVTVSAVTMVGGAIPLCIFSLPTLLSTSWGRVPGSAWGAVIYSGLGALVIAYLFWSRGVRVLGPTRTALYGNLQPVIALLAAWIWLGEVPTPWQGVGTAGIIAGILLTRL